jgi:hypothetical protein
VATQWKRASDPETDRPKAFGLCTYDSKLAALKALKVFNGYTINGRSTVAVKCDVRTRYLP